jgi:tryptophanase
MTRIIEPFRIKVVEPIPHTTREERSRFLEQASYNPFRLRAEQVMIDLLTDSGTSAMSTRQWAGMMEGDESYAGARSFFRFREAVREIFGHRHVIPTHQGRAAERLLCSAVLDPDSVVPGNTHFDTTRANIEVSSAQALDLPTPEADNIASDYPFKGNIDLAALEHLLESTPRERIPFVLITVTNNSGGGQPVSMANLRATRELCERFGVPLLLDAARFAENAYFIKQRENGYADTSPREIAREMFALTDGALMSMKKDAFGNIGGVISIDSDIWAEQIRTLLILTEGFPTYGGLAGRDLEALAAGLHEVLDEDYLRYRIASTAYLGERLDEAEVPVVKPFGGHAIYIDGRAFCAHLTNEQLPGWSLAVALYEELGVRACEIGNVMFGRPGPDGGTWAWPRRDLVRLAIPRRVYTKSQIDYVSEGIAELFESRHEIRGLRFLERAEVLPHFTARFEPLPAASEPAATRDEPQTVPA